MQLGAESFGGRSFRLVMAMAIVWLLAIVPAWKFFGQDGLVAVSISAVVCLVPGCLVFWLTSGEQRGAAQIRAVAAGTLLRMFSAGAGGWVMHQVLGFPPHNYLIWLGLCYATGLAVETGLILSHERQARVS